MQDSRAEEIGNKVITFGCRLNAYESEVIRSNLEKANATNCIVINTCSVTQEAIKKAKQEVRTQKRKNPLSKIIVTGCAAQINPTIFSAMPEVDQVIGNEEKLHHVSYQNTEKILVNDIMSVKETAQHLVSHFEHTTRAFLQIQNGCNHRCTFCTIPYGRGNNRSVPVSAIINQIMHLVQAGYKEVVLTGVDITDYGADLPNKPTLGQITNRILNSVPNLQRLRLSSIDVAEVDSELLELIMHHPRLMPHLHISLQSGDNMILKRMKRRHNREQVIAFCNNVRSKRSEIAFGADIIAGFPTETDQMFENTKNLIKEANLQYLHVFPYSAHPNTPAAKMPQVENKLKKERAQILVQDGKEQLHQFLENNVGKYGKLLTEKGNVGHTENFILAKIHNAKVEPGTILLAKLEKVEDGKMVATII
jgi:threonylcarbamoyladenosine tRNA methylthiotransferase MtaB